MYNVWQKVARNWRMVLRNGTYAECSKFARREASAYGGLVSIVPEGEFPE